MTHPLHDYLAGQLADKLKDRKVVVWYDARSEFMPFIDEMRGAPAAPGAPAAINVAGVPAQLAEYNGSMLELRDLVERHVSADEPDNVLVYVGGQERDRRGSLLMELETAGICYEPQLKRSARRVLQTRYTDGVIDDMLKSDSVTYADLARASSGTDSGEPPSLLKAVFHDVSSSDILPTWLVADERDDDIDSKGAGDELRKLLRSRLGLESSADDNLTKLRSIALRYVLAGEFRSDLSSAPPAALDSVSMPKAKSEVAAVRDLASRLRVNFSDRYPAIADRVEDELGLRNVAIPAESLGSIDTFRFEERTLLAHCCDLIVAKRFDEVLQVVADREHCFWLSHDLERKAQWEACRLMAELGSVATIVHAAVRKAGDDADAWVQAYTAQDNGWYRLDQAQRRLEVWVTNLDDEAEERALGVVRRIYEDACHAMAEGFTKALTKANWTVPSSMHQTHVFSEVVDEQPTPVAYFLVDAMRYEMGVELSERLPDVAEVSVRHAITALPSITPIGMAALQPGASSSFSVVEQGGRLGSRIDDVFLPDLVARRKLAQARIPGLVDITLNELLGQQLSKLKKKFEGAKIIIVRSQEIDQAGETGFSFQARQVMDNVIDNLARSIRRLTKFGVTRSVISADHGHLFFAYDRDESMRTDGPGGAQVELHRRCWIGRGGATPPGCLRIPATAVGYDSDLEFVFPIGSGVFKAGGDLMFHHGGLSLQEVIVPVLTVRMASDALEPRAGSPVTATGLPDRVTNRIFSVTLHLGGSAPDLFASGMTVRPLLMSAGKQVGAVGMAVDVEHDRTTGCIELQQGKPATIAFLLTDEGATSLRVVVQDPTTDAELYRSPDDIPVHLGV